MTITAADLYRVKPKTITDTSINGGAMGDVVVQPRVKYAIIPRVSQAERLAGIGGVDGNMRVRKLFDHNRHVTDPGFEHRVVLEIPTNAEDNLTIGKGTQTDTQADLTNVSNNLDDFKGWRGCGQLNADLVGGETSVQVLMEPIDSVLVSGGLIFITNKVSTAQTIGAGVVFGDSVEESAGTWQKIIATEVVAYPKGIYLGDNKVYTWNSGTYTEDWVRLPENMTEEVIGTGTGSVTPSLSAVTDAGNGLLSIEEKPMTVKAVCGGTERTVTIGFAGVCSGYCSAGQINMTTGVWTTPITWTTGPDTGVDITITAYTKCWTVSGDVMTIETTDQVAHAYSAANTYIGGVIEYGTLTPSADVIQVYSSLGTYDDTTYPVTLDNQGTVEDEFVLTFTSTTNFNCVRVSTGETVGTGNTGSDFSAPNSVSGTNFFTLLALGFSGTYAAAETIRLKTHPAAAPYWLNQDVPAGAGIVSLNMAITNSYCE